MPKLSDTKLRGARPRPKPFKLYDTDGLFLLVTPKGGRWWRLKYFRNGRERGLSLGTYPEVGLALARDRRDDARELIAKGIDPSVRRQEDKAAARNAEERTYKAVAMSWLALTAKGSKCTEDHVERVRRRQEVHTFPWLGSKPVSGITESDVLSCLKRVADRGLIDTAHRLRADTDAIFAYAKRYEFLQLNPCADLRGSDTLPKVKVEHNAAITDPREFGLLLRALDTYPGRAVSRFCPFAGTE